MPVTWSSYSSRDFSNRARPDTTDPEKEHLQDLEKVGQLHVHLGIPWLLLALGDAGSTEVEAGSRKPLLCDLTTWLLTNLGAYCFLTLHKEHLIKRNFLLNVSSKRPISSKSGQEPLCFALIFSRSPQNLCGFDLIYYQGRITAHETRSRRVLHAEIEFQRRINSDDLRMSRVLYSIRLCCC